jgi:hypothetical protein
MKDFVTVGGLGAITHSVKHGEGYHVIAKSDVKKGKLIERCPMFKLAHKSNYISDPQILSFSIIEPSNDVEDIKEHGYSRWIVLGNGAFYERSENVQRTQAFFDFKFDKSYVDIVAIKDISKNTSIIVGNVPFAPKEFIPSHNNPVVRSSEPEVTDEEFMESMKALMNANS